MKKNEERPYFKNHQSLFDIRHTLPLIFPNHFYQFCFVGKIGAFAVAFAGDAATGGTDIIALFIYHLVKLIAAIAAEQKNTFAIVAVFNHFCWRVPPGLLFDGVNPGLDTGGNPWRGSFVALLLRCTNQKVRC
jgi:hypothetical protein